MTEFGLNANTVQRKNIQDLFPANLMGNMVNPTRSAQNLGAIP